MNGNNVILDDTIDHPVCVTFDDTKQDGSFPCIMGSVLFTYLP